MKRARLFRFLALLLAAGVALVWWTSSRNERRRTVVLGNGTRLTFCGVSAGTNCSYPYGTVVGRLAAGLPFGWGANLAGGAGTETVQSHETNLVIWFVLRGGSYDPGNLRFQIVDDDGHSRSWYDVNRPVSGWTTAKSVGSGMTAVYRRHPVWPRRSKEIALRIFDLSFPPDRQLLAEFRVPNPARGVYPEWTPESPPISCRDGNAVFTLERFMLGPESRGLYHADRVAPELFGRASFMVTDDSDQKDEWTLWSTRVADATGNRQFFWGSGPQSTVIRRLDSGGPWPLWPGEKAIKLETLWVPRAGHKPAEIFALSIDPFLMPVDTPTRLCATNVGRSFIVVWANFSSRPTADEVFCRMMIGGTNVYGWSKDDTIRPELLGGTDDKGRQVRLRRGGEFIVWRDAKSLELRIGLAKGRVAEFIVAPEFHSNGLPPLNPSQ